MLGTDNFYRVFGVWLQVSTRTEGVNPGRLRQERALAVSRTANSWRCIIGLLVALSPIQNAFSAEGVITELLPGCSYFVLKASDGYAVMEWNGDGKPGPNERLLGKFSSGSMNILENATRGGKVKVWIEDYPISYDDAVKLYKSECH